MVLQVANMVSGFVLGASKLKEFGGKTQIESAESTLAGYRSTIGVVTLILGVVGLIDRIGIVRLYLPWLGSSFPQALPAIAMGLILSASYFEKYPAMHDLIVKLKAYEVWIGVVGIVVGLWSLLFGCTFCSYGYYY